MAEFFDNMVSFEKELNTLTVALRILMAIIFGGIIGIERDRHGSQAGMRTHILVALGASSVMIIGQMIICQFLFHHSMIIYMM